MTSSSLTESLALFALLCFFAADTCVLDIVIQHVKTRIETQMFSFSGSVVIRMPKERKDLWGLNLMLENLLCSVWNRTELKLDFLRSEILKCGNNGM
jgi:hypothetical protein